MRALLVAVGVLLAATSRAGSIPDGAGDGIVACRAIIDGVTRLGCYDRLASAANAAGSAPRGVEVPPPAASPSSEARLPSTPLAARWELGPDADSKLFRPRPHEPTYLLPVHWTSSINAAQYARTELQPVEGKFQLSLKLKMASDVLGTGGNLWAGYTQQSYWQVYNSRLSRPFLETDYEPEFIWSQPIHFEALGFTARLLNLGLLHQSNGLSDPLSRSWNRVYAELGLERGEWTVLLRPWVRLAESRSQDDNPLIERYLGRGQVVAIWKHGAQSLTFTGRDSFTGAMHGSGQVDYAVPVVGGLKGYLQVFSGYGESIIDYNHRQTTVGIGILITDVL